MERRHRRDLLGRRRAPREIPEVRESVNWVWSKWELVVPLFFLFFPLLPPLNLDLFSTLAKKKTAKTKKKKLSSPAFASLQGLPRDRPLRAIELGSGVSALPCLVAARLTRGGRRRRGDRKEAKAGEEDEDGEDGGGDGGAPSSPPPPPPLPLFMEIFATDIDECLPGLEANAVKNAPATTRVQVVRWEEGEGEREEGEEGEEGEEATKTKGDEGEKPPLQVLKLLDLDWRLFPRATALSSSFLRAPFDVVLVADAVYVSALMPALVEAMRCVSDEGSVVLLAYFLRSEAAHAQFWPRLRAAFEVEHVPAASFGCAGADRGGGGGRGLFRLRKRSEGDYEELEEERRRRRAEEEEEEEEEGGKEEEEEKAAEE